MKRLRRTKIVATLGPASNTPEMVENLHRLGADVFRINMSHLDRGELAAQVRMIREVEARVHRSITVLVDLQGPKLRLGRFAEGAAELAEGAHFTLDDNQAPGDATRVHLPHPEILSALEPGHAVLIDDGKLRLEVEEVESGHWARAVVRVGGRVSDRKGVSLPDTTLPLAAMTDKDRADLEAAIEIGVDWIALSFVQRPEDIAEVKKVARGRAQVLAKLEKPQALARLDEIMDVSDAIMVARGDLGVEMPLEKVPGLQKRITRTARRAGKPVIVATQMLESMITSPVPTRAEVSDVATAVYEGADAVMLSAESAAGQYPLEAVAQMNRIAEEVERDSLYWTIIKAQQAEPEATGSDAIAAAAHGIASTLGISTIAAWTFSGATALRLARERPDSTILALTPKREAARRINLAWGIHAVVTRDASDVDDMTFRACKFALRSGLAEVGERIIVIAGVPFGTPGATNMIRIAYITDEHAKAAGKRLS